MPSNVKKFVVWDVDRAKLVSPQQGVDKRNANVFADALEARNGSAYMVLPAG